jgi:hypothetical protein
MNLNTITSCTKDKIFGGLSVKADILVDLVHRQWSWSISAFGISLMIERNVGS